MATMKIRKRQLILGIIIIAVLLALLGKVAYLQFVRGNELTEKAYYQQTKDMIVSAKRGTIYDSTGKILAQSATTDCISLDIAQIKEPEKIAKKLSEVLDMDYDEILEKAKNTKVATEIVKRRVEEEPIKEIRKWISEEKITGINITDDSKRYYPFNNFASHVVGFTGSDNQGLSGIEMVYDKVLRGTPGRVFANVDAGQKEMTFADEKYYNPEDGSDITLTIDYNIQAFLENHLETAVVNNRCTGGATAIAMNPKTGEILGLAVKPDFDLNNPFEPNTVELRSIWDTLDTKQKISRRETMWRNKALVDTYEPGSVFKTITTAMAIEENLVRPDELVTCSPITVGEHTIHCWTSPHGTETFTQAMQNSCNPVLVQIGQRLGREKFYKYMESFGLKSTTGIELPEVKGQLHDYKKFGIVELATSSFGMRFNVTPIEMITALSATINGGELLKPGLVKKITDANGNVTSQFEREVVKTVISEETSKTVREILESVVSIGTGKNARVSGYRIGGKTGTADLLDGTYVISFFGFAPANDPEIAILLVLYNPTGDTRTGGATAAPVVGAMFKDILPYMNQEPTSVPETKTYDVKVPNVVGLTIEEAQKKLSDGGLVFRLSESNTSQNSLIVRQTPQADALVSQGTQVILYTEAGEVVEKKIVVPDLTGSTIEEAKQKLESLGLTLKEVGKGKASEQTPVANTEVLAGTTIEVRFKEEQ